ncbi:capsule assembly Wzi family protein [Shivajiella indica]|uniref:Capsule assembly Wzi family protein n=1 Tax=Shivajiella indica TaxID=872115 RepID=A0ABW5BE34_9BACT
MRERIYKILLFIFFGFGAFPLCSYSQTVPLNTPVLEEYMRRRQLIGSLNENVSFAIRPLHPAPAFDRYIGIDLDSTFTDFDTSKFHYLTGKKNKNKLITMPLTLRTQYNSEYAFGPNNGAMIPNRGFQHILSAGFYLQEGKFSIQIQPELLLAQNKDYLGFPIEHESTILFYYEYMNRIDMPERFGEGEFNRLLPGQSSIRFNPGGFSFGLSTENLWWGPSKRNSLILSNNAQGFLHFTANTLKPVKTGIGYFEGQFIAGLLNSSGYLPPHPDYSVQGNPALIPKRANGERYLSGLIFSYKPKWVPGLFLGYSATNHLYREDMDRLGDYVPIFNGQKGLYDVFNPIRDKRQQFSSGFFRWISPEGHFEFYGEYGTNGNSIKFGDFLITPEKNRGFTLGFSNLVPLSKERQFLQISAEMTQTGQPIRESIRNLDTWYIHNHVRDGYTHNGQVLGVGYGPASNVNWIEIGWVKDFSRIAFHFERIVYNNDFYYFRYEGSKDWRNKYVDLVPSLVADWRFGNLLVHGNFQYVNTLNYMWFLENQPDQYFVPGLDRNNFVGTVGISYIFK